MKLDLVQVGSDNGSILLILLTTSSKIILTSILASHIPRQKWTPPCPKEMCGFGDL